MFNGKKKRRKASQKIIIYILTFIFSLHMTPALYINSSYLEQFMPKNIIGIVYTVASIITIFGFFGIRILLKRYGNYRVFNAILVLEILALLCMALAPSGAVAIGAFIASFALTALAFFNLDVFLESLSVDNETGIVRGIYLTSQNLAFMLGPLLAGLLLTDHDFWKVYILGAILILPILFIFSRYTKDFKDPEYEKPEIFKTILHIWSDRDLHYIFSCGFLMRFFFSWMVIYSPLLLIDYVGFTIAQTTAILAIALIPYLLFEFILGKLADEKYGEKEILTIGFIIAAIAVGAMSFFSEKSFFLWAGILFMTRVGASMIEIMTETYLFKKIEGKNINILGFYRIVRPLAYVFGPLIASLILTFAEIQYLFIVLAFITLYGVRYSLALKDTK